MVNMGYSVKKENIKVFHEHFPLNEYPENLIIADIFLKDISLKINHPCLQNLYFHATSPIRIHFMHLFQA